MLHSLSQVRPMIAQAAAGNEAVSAVEKLQVDHGHSLAKNAGIAAPRGICGNIKKAGRSLSRFR